MDRGGNVGSRRRGYGLGIDADLNYDRQLLLNGAKRDVVLDVAEVRQYGIDSYGDPDYVSIYGMRPNEWSDRGIRVLGRTAVECTRDVLATAMAADVAQLVQLAPLNTGTVIVDPFAGSCNTLYWLTKRLPGSRGMGVELDDQVFRLTSGALARLGLPIELVHAGYRSAVAEMTVTTGEFVVAFLAPPWGDALSPTTGLDLGRTTPPVGAVLAYFFERFANPMLCAVQIFETTLPASLHALTTMFEWSTVRVYDLNAPGQNHGLLIGSRGWIPHLNPVGETPWPAP